MSNRLPASSLFTVPLVLSVLLLLTACSGDSDKRIVRADAPPRGEETRVIFNPSAGELPIPNDLLFARETAGDGTMNAGDDPANPVITGIDALDGNSVLSPVDIAFSGSLDDSQTLDAASFVVIGNSIVPNPDQNVFLLPLTYPGGDALSQAQVDLNGDGTAESVEIPTFVEAMAYQRAVAGADQATLMELAAPTARAEIISLDGGIDNVLRIAPLKPLLPETKYLVVITNDLQDAAGYAVYPSHAYNFIKNPESPFDADDDTNRSLSRVRAAISGWERLATGYFGFMQSVFDAAGVAATAPSPDDIVFSLTFTTGGTDAILKSIAAPEVFFEKSLRTGYRQDAIAKLVDGTYNLSGDNSTQTSVTDSFINGTINFLLTSPSLPDTSPNPLYSEALANAIAAGADYATLAADASAAFRMQTAAAEAAIQVHNSGDPNQGDKEPYVDIATEAAGTVAAIAQGAQMPVADLFPVPAPRATSFYRVDNAKAINSALAAPAKVYQGEITLPFYQAVPEAMDGSSLKTSSWIADPTIGAVIDAGRENPAGTTPPSDKITYRYPFPQKQGNLTVPLLATLPDAQTLASLGVNKPAEGWPVIIYVHGITTERSISLPMADAMAFACINPETFAQTEADCFATIAIDQPLHGITPSGSMVSGLVSVTDPDNTLTPNVPSEESPVTPSANLTERHFDFTADAATNPIPMDYASDLGESGSLFINLSHFTNARSNLQQMVLDLLNLNASIADMDIDGDGTADDIDPARVYFVGHSLGAINGIAFIAVNNDTAVQNSPFSSQPAIKAASLMNTGGGVPRLLTNSPSLAPRVLPGLANASEELTQGRSGLETYLNVFQGVLDSVDAMNFAASLSDANSSTGILVTEVVGDGTDTNPPDQTIPNAADTRWGDDNGPLRMVLNTGFEIAPFPAPLAGTEPLAAQFSAVPTAEGTADDEDPAVLITRFTEGSHGTPVVAGNTDIDPLTSGAVFAELVRQTVTFFTLDGVVQGSIVNDTTVVE